MFHSDVTGLEQGEIKVLVLGAGGAREHALAWALERDECVKIVFVDPGNAGTIPLMPQFDLSKPQPHLTNPQHIADAVRKRGIGLVIPASDELLVKGMVDELIKRRVPTFGPTKAAAKLEGSKAFAIGCMREANIPHAESWIFSNLQETLSFLKTCAYPIVIKKDGLARGKGVKICHSFQEAEATATDFLGANTKEPLILQKFIKGQEVSVFCFTDGKTISSLVAACDYKRRNNGNTGPMTGSMGSYSPPIFWNAKLEKFAHEKIVQPIVDCMRQRGTPFCGVIYAGLIIPKDCPTQLLVLEFNCRLGDAEAQVILPQLKTPIATVIDACIKGRLDQMPIAWNSDRYYVGIVLAARQYPEGPGLAGHQITGIREALEDQNVLIFHASTRKNGTRVETDNTSGRKLTVVGSGATKAEARKTAYAAVAKIHFVDMDCRPDIAA